MVGADNAVPVSKAGELALLSCLLHEGGHITAMAVMGIKPRSLTFYSGGIGMKSGAILSPAREIFILSAGCLVNLLLALAGTLTGKEDINGDKSGADAFNLLPLPSLDGGVSCARSWKQYSLPQTSRGAERFWHCYGDRAGGVFLCLREHKLHSASYAGADSSGGAGGQEIA